jgi:putative Holliday junction resolvase
MRVAALDVGDARVGVAVSDGPDLGAHGIGVVHRVGGQRDLMAIGTMLAPYEPEHLIVGLPLNMDGSEGPRAARTRAFGQRVASHLRLPVDFVDERLTTFEAEERLRAAGVPPRRRRELVDQQAAMVILESWLAAQG